MKKLVLMALLVSSPAFAEGPSRERMAVKIGSANGARAALERFKKAGAGERGTQVEPVKKPAALEGRVIRGGDGALFLEREVDAPTAENLLRMGYRAVTSEKEIQDKTVLGTKVYVLYQVDADAVIPKGLKNERVKLDVRFDRKGTPIVTSLRRVDR